MIDWIMTEGAGHSFFYAFPFCLLALFCLFKGRRIKFIIPSILITLVIVNPWFYQWWDKLGLYAYWRLLWAVPVVSVIAAVIPAITEIIKSADAGTESETPVSAEAIGRKPKCAGTAKLIITAVGIIGIAFGGSFMYSTTTGQFETPSSNSSKVPDQVAQIADKLLELNEHPRVILQDPLGIYIRQYAGEIVTLYGRDMSGFIIDPSETAKKTSKQISANDFASVSEVMLNDGYDYIVVNDDQEERRQKLAANGFEFIDRVGSYGIYQPNGKPTQKKEKNELGQVISVTCLDEAGQPIIGENGYATVLYEYDTNGNITKEFRTDLSGNGVADSKGQAGYERKYDIRSHVIMERYLGSDGKPVANSNGYAEVRRAYQGKYLINESYYNSEGNPVKRIDKQYASVAYTRNAYGNAVEERYIDQNGTPAIASNGCASVKREYDRTEGRRNLLRRETYYGADDSLILNAKGYAGFLRTYDQDGYILSEQYIGTDGKPVNNINGYAKDEREYDKKHNITVQRFMNADNKLVITGAGFAEVHRVYENKHVIHEEYYGADGEPMVQAAGYTAIDQTWDGDNLVSRTYLDSAGQPMNRVDGYAKAVWEEGGTCRNLAVYDADGNKAKLDTLNLAKDIKYDADGWSSWQTPSYNVSNSTQTIGSVNLGEKAEGDVYTCQIEIEFKDVTPTDGRTFRFRTQGSQDGGWTAGNVWNNSLINLTEVPENGIYRFTTARTVSGAMADISTFNIGFRCDYWASGSYRVRNVKIEKGDQATEWSPGL